MESCGGLPRSYQRLLQEGVSHSSKTNYVPNLYQKTIFKKKKLNPFNFDSDGQLFLGKFHFYHRIFIFSQINFEISLQSEKENCRRKKLTSLRHRTEHHRETGRTAIATIPQPQPVMYSKSIIISLKSVFSCP